MEFLVLHGFVQDKLICFAVKMGAMMGSSTSDYGILLAVGLVFANSLLLAVGGIMGFIIGLLP